MRAVTHYVGDQCPGGHYEETDVSDPMNDAERDEWERAEGLTMKTHWSPAAGKWLADGEWCPDCEDVV